MTAEPFDGYEAAIERASWVRKGAAKVLFGRHAARSQIQLLYLQKTAPKS